ncbi:MAG TPA: hypothetical protein VGD15_01785, partial [Kribbella sp.]
MSAPVVDLAPAAGADAELRDQLSNLQGLLMLSMLMTESGDEDKIVQLAGSSLPSFGCCRLVGVYFPERGWVAATPSMAGRTMRADLETRLVSVGRSGGTIEIPGENWAWALPMRGVAGHVGFFVTAAETEPSTHAQFLCRVLAQQTGVALANARLHAKERATAEELRGANTALAETVRALEQTTQIHDRFTRVAVAGEGQEGIARAVHELTGFPVAVEDRYGNLRAWAGPNRPDPYPK